MGPRLTAVWRIAAKLLPAVFLALAAYVLWRELHLLSPEVVFSHMAAWGWPRIAGAIILSVTIYVLLAANEALTLRHLQAPVPFGDIAAVSFIAYAFGNNLGFNLLIAGVVRARAYGRFGVNLSTVAVASLICSMVFWIGLAAVAGASLILAEPERLARLGVGRWLGALLLAAPILAVAVCALWRKPVERFGRTWTLPPANTAAVQILLGVLVNVALAAIPWLLAKSAEPLAPFAGAYAASFAAGLISGVPGGIGVFEGGMLTLLPALDRAALTAAFVGYRLFYDLIPLIMAAVLFALRERPWRRRGLA